MRSMGNCCFCDSEMRLPAKHNIHRDGPEEGPEVPLCLTCAMRPEPTMETVWAKLKADREPKSVLAKLLKEKKR